MTRYLLWRSNVRRLFILSWFGFIAGLLMTIGAYCIAQESGAIEGKLLDSAGTPVAGAKVNLENSQTSNKLNTMSNDKGEFKLLDILPGTYTLTVEADGYTAIKKEGISVKAGSSASFEMLLVPEKRAEKIETAPAEEKTAAAESGNGQGKAMVYVYRHKRYEGFALNPGVYLDDKEVAAMENGRYFAIAIEPGPHVLRSNDKNSGVQMEFKANETYYARIDIKTGFWKGHGMLVLA